MRIDARWYIRCKTADGCWSDPLYRLQLGATSWVSTRLSSTQNLNISTKTLAMQTPAFLNKTSPMRLKILMLTWGSFLDALIQRFIAKLSCKHYFCRNMSADVMSGDHLTSSPQVKMTLCYCMEKTFFFFFTIKEESITTLVDSKQNKCNYHSNLGQVWMELWLMRSTLFNGKTSKWHLRRNFRNITFILRKLWCKRGCCLLLIDC